MFKESERVGKRVGSMEMFIAEIVKVRRSFDLQRNGLCNKSLSLNLKVEIVKTVLIVIHKHLLIVTLKKKKVSSYLDEKEQTNQRLICFITTT